VAERQSKKAAKRQKKKEKRKAVVEAERDERARSKAARTQGEEAQGEEEDESVPQPQSTYDKEPPGSLRGLEQLFALNTDDKRMVCDLILDVEKKGLWQPLLSSLTIEQYAGFVGKVNLDFDKPEVAWMLGTQLTSGLTSAHVVAAVRQTENYKAQLVRKVAPKVSDLGRGRAAIEAELTEWERMLTRGDLDRAEREQAKREHA